jgi:predicted transcriptional regulator with HTH domain
MIEQLFGSKTRVKLLQLFYSNPNRSFYVREITRKVDEQINSVRRELSNLLSIGIISSETNNNRLYYEVNQTYEYYDPLARIFGGSGAATSSAAAGSEDNMLKQLGRVDLAILVGKFTRDEKSGVDILVVGDINATQMAKYVSELEAKEGKELRYAVMTTDEFIYRRKVNDRFLINVLDSKKQVLVDKEHLLSDSEPDSEKEIANEE